MSFYTDTAYLRFQTTHNFANGEDQLTELADTKTTETLVCVRSIAEKCYFPFLITEFKISQRKHRKCKRLQKR